MLAWIVLLPSAATAAPLSVFAGVEPVRYLVEAVGGDRVSASVLVPPGQSPHTFSPSPGQLAGLERADLYFAAAMPFEEAWVPRMGKALPHLGVVPLLDDTPHHGHGHDHEDPHPWTDPLQAIALADRIRRALGEADPEGASRYEARFRALERDLRGAHRDMAETLAPVRGRSFVVYHPAWGALAGRYGLRQLAVEASGKSPGARHLAELITEARRSRACAVFVQPQYSTRAARTVADALDVPVVTLDPLSGDLVRDLPRVAGTLARYMERPCPR